MHKIKFQKKIRPSMLAASHLPEELRTRLLITPVEAGVCLGWAKQTVYNKICKNTFPIQLVELGGRKMVRVSDLLEYINGLDPNVFTQTQRRRPGRPKKEGTIRREAEEKGVSA